MQTAAAILSASILVLSIGAVCVVFDSMRRIRSGGFSRSATRSLLLGVALCAAASAASYDRFHMASLGLQVLYEPSKTSRSPPAPKPEWSEEKRREFDRLIGRIVYQETGKLRTDSDGTKLYVPTQDEIADREQAVAAKARQQTLASEWLSDAISIWFACVVAASLGFLWPRRNAP